MVPQNIMKSDQLLLLVLLAIIATIPGHVKSMYCAFLDPNRPHEAYEIISKPGMDLEPSRLENVKYQAGKGEIQDDNVTIRCLDGNHYCYSLWKVENNHSTPVMIMQGCWDHADAQECGRGACISNRSDAKFCCCHGDWCNVNVTDGYVPPEPSHLGIIDTKLYPRADYVRDESYRIRAIVISLSSVSACALVIAVGFLLYRRCLIVPKAPPELPTDSGTTPSYQSGELSLGQFLVRGRFGQIWRANLNTEQSVHSVIVKILTANHEKHYVNERDVYCLPFMDHPSLLAFYGCETRLVEGIRQHWLVLEYLELGSLSCYLKNNVIDWNTLCKMCYSTASGLAHLHTDIAKGGLVKPVIAHRDVTTCNILVRPDLSCCLADFGFALQLKGSTTDVRDAEPSLTDVGTLRYMSPEALDGAVNLRDCESSLKQIDVYALGLVIWEIATRCSDLYQGLRVPDYQLPFTVELGQSPSFDDMQLFVSRHKLRPSFPDLWKDSNLAIRLLKETIEECWDQDAEARLTAMCVQERCIDMGALWKVKYCNVMPMSHQGLADKAVVQRNPCSPTTQPDTTLADKNANLSTVVTSLPVSQRDRIPMIQSRDYTTVPTLYQRPRPPSYSTDERSSDTVISLLLPSPSDPPYLTRNQLAINQQQTHGRNAMVERNTHKRSDEDMTVDGNAIIDSARPRQTSKVTSIFLDTPPQTTTAETSALVEHDDLRAPPEIPYLQNQIPYEQNPTHNNMPAKRYNLDKPPPRFSLSNIKTALNSLLPKRRGVNNVTDLGMIAAPAQRNDGKPCNLNNPRACLPRRRGSPRETSVSLVNGEPRVRTEDGARPSSLALDSRELKSGDQIKYRVKTPHCSVRPQRFSLYDDRMMDHRSRDSATTVEKSQTSISLQQFSHEADDELNNNRPI